MNNNTESNRVKIRYAGSIDIQDSAKQSVLKAKAIFDYSNPLLELEPKGSLSRAIEKQLNNPHKNFKSKHVKQYKISFSYTCTSGDSGEVINPQITSFQRLDKTTTTSDHQFVSDKLKPVMSRIVQRLIEEYRKSKSTYPLEEKDEKSLTANAYTLSISSSDHFPKEMKTEKLSTFSKSVSPYLLNSYSSTSIVDKDSFEYTNSRLNSNIKQIKTNSNSKGTKTVLKHNNSRQVKRIQKYHSSHKSDFLNTELGKNESYEIVCCSTKNFIHPKMLKDTFLFKKIKLIYSQNEDLRKLCKKPSVSTFKLSSTQEFNSITISDFVFMNSSLTYNNSSKDVFKINLENLISYRRNIHFSQFNVVEKEQFNFAEITPFGNFICILASLDNWNNFRKRSNIYDNNYSNDGKDSPTKSENNKSKSSSISLSKKDSASQGSRRPSRRISRVERCSILQRLSLNAGAPLTFLEEEESLLSDMSMSDCPLCHGDPIMCLEAEGRKSLIESYVTLLQESKGIHVKRRSNNSIDMQDLKILLYDFMAENNTYPTEHIKEEMLKRQESLIKKKADEEEHGYKHQEVLKGEGKNPNLPQHFLKSLTKKVDKTNEQKKGILNNPPRDYTEVIRTVENSYEEIEINESFNTSFENDPNKKRKDQPLPKENYVNNTGISTDIKEVVEYVDSDQRSSIGHYMGTRDTMTSDFTLSKTAGKKRTSQMDSAAKVVKEWLTNIQPILKEIEYMDLKQVPSDVLQNNPATLPISVNEMSMSINSEDQNQFASMTTSALTPRRSILIHTVSNSKASTVHSKHSKKDKHKTKSQKDGQEPLSEVQINNDSKAKINEGDLLHGSRKNQEMKIDYDDIFSKDVRSNSYLERDLNTSSDKDNNKESKRASTVSKTKSNKEKVNNRASTGGNENRKLNSKSEVKPEKRKSLMKSSVTTIEKESKTIEKTTEMKAEPRRSLLNNSISKANDDDQRISKNFEKIDEKFSPPMNENENIIVFENVKKPNDRQTSDSKKFDIEISEKRENDGTVDNHKGNEFLNEAIYVEIDTKKNIEDNYSFDKNAKETVQIMSPITTSSNSGGKRISTFDASISKGLYEAIDRTGSSDNSSTTSKSQDTSNDFSAKYTNESPELKKLFNRISWENSQNLLDLLKMNQSQENIADNTAVKIRFSETKSNKSSNLKHVTSSFKGSFDELNKRIGEDINQRKLSEQMLPEYFENNRSKSLNRSTMKDNQFRPSSQNASPREGHLLPDVRQVTDSLNRNLDIHHMGDPINGLSEQQVINSLNHPTGSHLVGDISGNKLNDFNENVPHFNGMPKVSLSNQRINGFHYQNEKFGPNDTTNFQKDRINKKDQLDNRHTYDSLNFAPGNHYPIESLNQSDIYQLTSQRTGLSHQPDPSHIRPDIYQKSDALSPSADIHHGKDSANFQRGMYYTSDPSNLQMEIRHLTDPINSNFRSPITHNVEEFSTQKFRNESDDLNVSRFQHGTPNKEIDELLDRLKAILSKSEEFLQILSGFFSNIPRTSNTLSDMVNIPKEFYVLLKSICANKDDDNSHLKRTQLGNEKALNKICKMLGIIDEQETNKKGIDNMNDGVHKKKNSDLNKFLNDLMDEGKSNSEDIESNTYSLDINETFINKVVKCVLKKLLETNPLIFKDDNGPSDDILSRGSFISPKKENEKLSPSDVKYIEHAIEKEKERKSTNSKSNGDNKFRDHSRSPSIKTRKPINIASIIEDCLPHESKSIINKKPIEKKTLNSLVVCDEIANRMKDLLTEVKQSHKINRVPSPVEFQNPKSHLTLTPNSDHLNFISKDSKLIRSLSANCLDSSIVNPNPFASRHTVASIQNMISTPNQKQKMASGTRNIKKEIKDKSTRMFLNSRTRYNMINCNKNENNQTKTKSLSRNSNTRKIFK